MIYLKGLQKLFNQMQSKNIDHLPFTYPLNSMKFSGMFSVKMSPYDLALAPTGASGNDIYSLLFKVNEDFTTTSFIDNEIYDKLVKFLKTTGKSHKVLSMNEFMKELDDYCGSGKIKLIQATDKDVLTVRTDIVERDKPYFQGYLDNDCQGHKVSEGNLEKNRLLFGEEQYEYSKKNNVSLVWSAAQKK